MPAERPRVRELSREEVRSLLERNNVGRLAYCHEGIVGITPIHYVVAGDWLYGRTAEGEKLEAVLHNRRVAVEVDEVEDLFLWRSAVVRGGLYVLVPDRSPEDRRLWEEGIRQVQKLIPGAFTPDDPTPDRAVLFRIAIQEATGRACGPA